VSSEPESRARIPGLDVARALAIFGMVAVNFELTLSNQLGSPWLERALQLPRGRASALFVVLAGIGVTLLGERARSGPGGGRSVIVRRGLFLAGLGYAFCTLWDADILHYYGFYFLVGALALGWSDRALIGAAVLCVLIAPGMLVAGMDFESGWILERLEYADLWTWSGQVRHLLFNGFHPLFPWLAFVFFGMWLGRRLLRDPARVQRLGLPALALMILVELGSALLVPALGGLENDGPAWLLSTSSMPAGMIYMLSAAATATAVLAGCMGLATRYPDSSALRALARTGRLALTLYLAHVLLGIGILDSMQRLHSLSLRQVFAWWALFCGAGVVSASLLAGRFDHGPLEALLRRFGDWGGGQQVARAATAEGGRGVDG
jgi:uncharacterized protein